MDNFRVPGMSCLDGKNEISLEKVKTAKGLGRWIYCKYCYKNVQPLLSGINQLICSKCGAGLSPDFFREENLRRWLSGDDSATKNDLESEEAKDWLAKKE